MEKVPSLGTRFIFFQPILVSVTRSKDIPSTWASPGRTWPPCYGAGGGNWELGLCCWALCGPATYCSSSQHGIHCGSWCFSLSQIHTHLPFRSRALFPHPHHNSLSHKHLPLTQTLQMMFHFLLLQQQFRVSLTCQRPCEHWQISKTDLATS